MVVLRLDFIAYLDAFIIGWIIVDILANVFISSGQSFTTIRFFGTTFLTRSDAILLAYGQTIVAMTASFYAADYFFGLIVVARAYVVPITLAAAGFFHLYILLGLPYKITLKRGAPSGVLLSAAYVISDRIGRDPSFAQWLTSLLLV